VVPKDGYMEKVKELCEKYNILLIADEVQTGLGRTGHQLAVDYDDCKPHIVILGKVMLFYDGMLRGLEIMSPIRNSVFIHQSFISQHYLLHNIYI